MKILIVSDTHRENSNFMKVFEKEKPIDMLIHCGDIEGSEYTYSTLCNCPMHMVAGNNDYFSQLPAEKEFTIGKYKVWLTHGHYYRVSMNYEILKQEARNRGVNIVMFGHTHRPLVDMGRGVIAVNPGSLTYPRQDGRYPSYIIMDVDEKGEAKFEIKFLEN